MAVLPLAKITTGNTFFVVFRVQDQEYNTLVDPSNLTVSTNFPVSETEIDTYGVEANITRLSEGRYRFEKLLINEPGLWSFTIKTTGTYISTQVFQVEVEAE